MSRLICPACGKTNMKWLNPDQENLLEEGIMKCQKKKCGREFVGIPGWRSYKKLVSTKLNIGSALDIIKEAFEDGQIEHNLGVFVARSATGKPLGIGTSFVSCIINTARRISGSKEPYNMYGAGNNYE